MVVDQRDGLNLASLPLELLLSVYATPSEPILNDGKRSAQA